MTENQTIEEQHVPVTIEDEMKRSYLDYAMSVIVSRALPDVRDGLKPVHRRILYSMHETGIDYTKPHKKSARIVGDVMGKYHPHSNDAIYHSLVRMAQDFSLRVPLIDGQGNFGSMDGDSAAAMRYTESRLNKIATTMLTDIDKDTVIFQDNYDGSESEPTVLPARFPNLLVNGADGIAVGMATTILTHNLGEVIDACCSYIENNDVTIEELVDIVKGPDFPTGGVIMGTTGSRSSLMTGRGSIIVRGKAHIEDVDAKKQAIIISEIPYQVNKSKLVERIAELVRDKKIEGISDLRDESDKQGVRIVIEVKKDAFPDVVLNQLYSFTPLQTSYGANMLALDHGKPRLMNLKDIITAFIDFREDVVRRRINYLLKKARERAHILIGLSIAVANIDEIITLIKQSPDANTAKDRLLEKPWKAADVTTLLELIAEKANNVINGSCYLTEVQAKAILEMRLQRLTGLEKNKIENELAELAKEIEQFLFILGNRHELFAVIKKELIEIKEEFATPRKTSIELSEFEQDIEDLIPQEEMVVTVTHGGYIKRVPLSTYRAQKRGGKGRSGMSVKEEDAITKLFVVNTHTPVLFFSTSGKVYKIKVYKLPLANIQSKGRALVNIFPLADGETINQVMPLPTDENSWDELNIFFATSFGNIRRNSLAEFRSVQSNGKIAIGLEEGDRLIGVRVCSTKDHIFLAGKLGRSVRFPVESVRLFKGRKATGVRGMRLKNGDEVISLSVLSGADIEINVREEYLKIPVDKRRNIAALEENDSINDIIDGIECSLSHDMVRKLAKEEEFILTITENGFGKRTSAYEYRVTNRGGSGVVNIITSARNGNVIASMPISNNDDIMLMTDKGTIIRCPVIDVRITGRNTQGVVLFRTSDQEKVKTAARIIPDDHDKDIENIEEDIAEETLEIDNEQN
jgi:DNA gyrase subunit A